MTINKYNDTMKIAICFKMNKFCTINKFFLFLLCLIIFYVNLGKYVWGYGIDPLSKDEIAREYNYLVTRININPYDVPALNSLGILYARAGQLNDAIQIWNNALKINPNYVHLYNNIASALKSIGRTNEALEFYRKGYLINPSFWIAYNLGILEKDRARYTEAYYWFNECLRLNPNFELAKQRIAELSNIAKKSETKMSIKPPIELSFESLGNDWIKNHTMNNETNKTIERFTMQQQNDDSKFGSKFTNTLSIGSINISRSANNFANFISGQISVETCKKIIENITASATLRKVAITFDDGPHPEITPAVLEILKKFNARATFFVVGSRAEMYPEIVEMIHKNGHEIGNHSWRHRSLVNIGLNNAREELLKTSTFVQSITGKACIYVRPPYGHTNSAIQGLINKLGFVQVLWDVDSRDWQISDQQIILRKILKQFAPNTIILFHDIHTAVLNVLPTLLQALKEVGYECVTITDLIRSNQKT